MPATTTSVRSGKRTCFQRSAQLALAQASEAGHCVQRRVLRVGALLLDVPLSTRPTAAAVHMPSLAGRSGEREDLLRRESVGRLGVVLAAFLGAADRVRGERERVRPTRVLEHVRERLAV
jgi:hypothetical protein